MTSVDTIVAIATPAGAGGIGIVRLSGPDAHTIARQVCGRELEPRHAHYCNFTGEDGDVIDQGIGLHFPAPNSFTGEHVVELQGHGGTVLLDLLVQRCCRLGARPARAGEFSERAFLNDRIDLTQAEAIADLIAAESIEAVYAANRSLRGAFSERVSTLVEELIDIRLFAEAAIDFPEEEIDFIGDSDIAGRVDRLIRKLDALLEDAWQGARLREGATVVLAGMPNAGKSSLLNQLSGRDSAIVTEIAGTTRDTIREQVNINGLPLHIIDTAGMNLAPDRVEAIGIERARHAVSSADLLLWVYDSNDPTASDPEQAMRSFDLALAEHAQQIRVANKIDLSGLPPGRLDSAASEPTTVCVCATTGAGIDALRQQIVTTLAFRTTPSQFTARRRHLEALQRARDALDHGYRQLSEHRAAELLADDLRTAQQQLDEITGRFTSDDLLGRIFASFCIGK